MENKLENQLQKRWEAFALRTGATKEIETAWEWIRSAHSESHRYYHNLNHVEQCLAEFDLATSHFHNNGLFVAEFAIWFHDSVYDTSKNTNELESAFLARNAFHMMGIQNQNEYSNDIIGDVSYYINYTAHKNNSWDSTLSSNLKLFLDIDLSILGQADDIFDTYERNIRREYDWVSLDIYRSERIKILERFLKQLIIFRHPHMREKYEAPARKNIQRSIDQLRK